jgi:ATP-dependent DNA ligase
MTKPAEGQFILTHNGRRLTELPLSERRGILSSVIEPGRGQVSLWLNKRSLAEFEFLASNTFRLS